jgi:DMSO/TMAO reductase YedYZ molybdopterin-dependent catalytic subunit
MKRIPVLWLMALVLVAAACAPAATPVPVEPTAVPPTAVPPTAVPPPTEAPAAAPTLMVTGLVAKELALAEADLRAMEVVDIQAEHPKKGMQDYTGVRLSELIALAQVKPEATTLVITASDGFSAEIDVPTLTACIDCLLAFTDTPESFSAVMPGQSSKLWVKDVVSLEFR